MCCPWYDRSVCQRSDYLLLVATKWCGNVAWLFRRWNICVRLYTCTRKCRAIGVSVESARSGWTKRTAFTRVFAHCQSIIDHLVDTQARTSHDILGVFSQKTEFIILRQRSHTSRFSCYWVGSPLFLPWKTEVVCIVLLFFPQKNGLRIFTANRKTNLQRKYYYRYEQLYDFHKFTGKNSQASSSIGYEESHHENYWQVFQMRWIRTADPFG